MRSFHRIARGYIISGHIRKRCLSTSSLSSWMETNRIRIENEANEDKCWVSTPEAKTVFAHINAISNKPTIPLFASEMNEYLSARGFNSTNSASFRILSSLLTFPLTMSFGLKVLKASETIESNNRNKYAFSIVGARAESSLPLVWWMESLYSAPEPTNMSISFFGPGLQPRKSAIEKQSHCFKDYEVTHSQQTDCTLTLCADPSRRTYFHAHPESENIMKATDVFIMYNPGLGATEELRISWLPTMLKLLESGKPLFLTAHSKRDLARDLHFLTEATSGVMSKQHVIDDHLALDTAIESALVKLSIQNVKIIARPQVNPFRSQKQTYDEKEEPLARVVTTNEYVYAIRGIKC